MKRVLALLCSLTVLCAALLVGVPTAQAAVDGTVRVWLESMNEYGTIQSVSITLDGSYSIPTAPEVSLSTRGTYYIENVDGTLMISGTGIDGQVAVGSVVINRVLSSVYPNTVSGVIYQYKQFAPVLVADLLVNFSPPAGLLLGFQDADDLVV